ncbi:DUF6092 family protein [Natronincola ferrireducens]|uniref:Uncharacterized protein n=1 Tax=Natronincola ferrireducens TaxID=393762 RepID=A0A1G8XXT2_9FIRM|nr:DUF6092 family protein [Natronincola ferrireducens]SDJ95358.1 hypothetical protein SAMN05660472_00360 [Natronincola ferrireducens]
MNNLQSVKEELEEIMFFLITSARGCIDEPASYGPLRLLEAASRLTDVVGKHNDSYIKLKDEINNSMDIALIDEEKFQEQLDDIILHLAKEVR